MKMKQLESMMEVEGVEEESELVMRFPKPFGVFDAGENLISVRDASFAWAEGGEPLFKDVDFTIGSKARITILGKNGCGRLLSPMASPVVSATFKYIFARAACIYGATASAVKSAWTSLCLCRLRTLLQVRRVC
jgi:ABC-type molybdenum transport system ATPase subunit/photorepair protein PhrA